MGKLTKEQFRAQFKYKVTIDQDVLRFDEEFYGYKIYRALQLLVLEDNGEFFVSRLQ